MNIKDYALTRENLVYLGLYEPFYELYCSYKDVLTNAQEELNRQKGRTVFPNEVKRFANNCLRQLLNDFFDKYSYIFTDEQYIFHVNAVFMKRMDIYDIKHIQPLESDVFFVSFEKFLRYFEDSVAYLIRNKKEKELCHPFSEEYVLKNVNNRINCLASEAKERQCVGCYPSTEICEELTVYGNLKNISCNQKSHKIISSFCYCRLFDSRIIKLPIHFCTTCNKSFIGIESLKIYEKTYGSIIVIKHHENECCFLSSLGESELYQTGYDARGNGMTGQERRAHLKFLIETGKMKPFEIIRDLESAIKLHKKNYQDRIAVEKWRKDLEYVNGFIGE